MTHARAHELGDDSFFAHRNPFGAAAANSDLFTVTIPDAVRRCRWIAMDINASAFGLYFVSPSADRPRLVPCFDSDYPGIAGATRNISTAASEDIIQHVRHSTGPRFWSTEIDRPPEAESVFPWIERTAALVPDTTGIAFPVHAERGQSGLVVFFVLRLTHYLLKRGKQKKLKEKYGGSTEDPAEMLEALLDYGILTEHEYNEKMDLLEA